MSGKPWKYNSQQKDSSERFRRRRSYRSQSQRQSGEASTSTGPPPHLKGRDIGLWYRNRQKTQKKSIDIENIKPLGSILISQRKKSNIEKLLNDTVSLYPSSFSDKSTSYEHLEETNFKYEFLQHRVGNIIKNLESLHNSKYPIKNNHLEDHQFLLEMQKKESSTNYKKMLEFRNKLPSMQMKNEILNLIEHNQITVISGETGCGKTTQVAQFILDDFIKKSKGSACKIICTQPRRISAISVAERVACERDEELGVSVGFQIRLEKTLPRKKGSILYCTTGVLLKHMESNPGLQDVSHLILDEIHERDVMTDFMITLLKDIIKYRTDLKVILMSATLNSEAFSMYYNKAPHINIPGFTYPVQEYFLEDVLALTGFKFAKQPAWVKKKNSGKYREWTELFGPYFRQLEAEGKYSRNVINELSKHESEELNVNLIFALIKKICQDNVDDGAILVFVPGFAEIQKICKRIEECESLPSSKFIIIPLHSQLSSIDQKQIFIPAPKGMRKIIVSTNIAETSITIDDVTTVIDCGYIKISNLDSETGIETLNAEFVSRANALQRKGRAGRVKPGVCFHLINKYRYEQLEQFLKPEVLRKRLEDVVLQLKMLQLGDAEPFLSKLMDPPELKSVQSSVELLKRLGALDEEEGLTPLGFHMAKIPALAQCSKMLILASLFSCIDPVLSVATSLSFKDAYQLSFDVKDADEKRFELSQGTNSDHMTLHYAIRGFEDANQPRDFCRKYYLSWSILKMLIDMKKQLAQLLFEMNFINDPNPKHFSNNYNSENVGLIKAIISAGLYPNVAIISKNKRHTTVKSINKENMKFHMKSVLSRVSSFPSSLIVYHQRLKTSKLFIFDATVIFPLPIVFFGDRFRTHTNDNNGFIGVSINRNMKFLCTESTSEIIQRLRGRVNQILEWKISHPGSIDWTSDALETRVLRIIMDLIASEDGENLDFSDYEDT